MFEVSNKAMQLFEENECDGILYRVTRTNPWGQVANCYFVYYDGKKFHKQGYIDKVGLMFEPFVMDEKQYTPALPVIGW